MTPTRIAGTVPGQLDPDQLHRLLRRPSSTLSFASFDPRVASADHGWDIRSLSLNEELYKQKRVVIETACSGESSWRFVPRARREDGVLDEGKWPRVITICGELVECSQDQWDIYKLDPAYDCLVRAPPELTLITPATPTRTEPNQPLGKHRMSSAEPCPEMPPTKTVHLDDEEEEVADMVIDGGVPGLRTSMGPTDRAKKYREEVEKNRRDRRAKVARRAEKLSSRRESFEFLTEPAEPSPVESITPENGKRKAASLFDSFRTVDDPHYHSRPEDEEESRNAINYSPAKASKRTRTFSPGAAKRDLERNRLDRSKQKQQRREQKEQLRKEQKYKTFLSEVYSEVPSGEGPSVGAHLGGDADYEVSDGSESGGEEPPASEFDPEAERMAAIAESRRKLAELEADRPLWEQEAKKREEREREEQEAQQARMAERRAAEARKADEERRAQIERDRKEAQEQRRIREAQERARREKEKRQRNERLSYGPWTTQRALERYKMLSDSFDSTKFSAAEQLSFEAIPWPVLHPPFSFSVEDIDWAAVEAFFAGIKVHMRPQDFVSLVEKSHRRFHPDRWRSRGLLKTVMDEAERGCLEVAANTVAQALTPLWRDLTGR